MAFVYLDALLKKPLPHTPIWVMRQAGRYLPEYRETRKRAGHFLDLCKNPELAAEVTVQPLRRFDLDAAILFSDILTIPDAMGLGLFFSDGEGPKFSQKISADDVEKLNQPPAGALDYVNDAIALVKQELNGKTPLIGFSGSPWTLATYIIEGGSSKNFAKIKSWLYRSPQNLHRLLDILSEAAVDYLNGQIRAGVDSLMIFDTWGGILTPDAFVDFSLAPMRKIIERIRRENDHHIPITIFTKGGGQWLEMIAKSGCDCIGIDWTVALKDAEKRVGAQVALQGNLDPAVLYAKPETIRLEVKKLLAQFSGTSGHIFNLGHGIAPDINPENMKILVDAVHEFSAR